MFVVFRIAIFEIVLINVWDEWWFHLLAEDLVPFDISEPRVLHHLTDALLPKHWVLLKHVG